MTIMPRLLSPKPLAAIIFCTCAVALTPGRTSAQTNIITTIVGSPVVYPNPANALNAPLGFPSGATADSQGNVYISDPYNERVFQLTPTGMIRTVAGNGLAGFSGDGGPATSATLNNPAGIAIDASGNLFIADIDNYRIREVSAAGIISTVAGNGTAGFSGDGGPALSAELSDPSAVAVDSSGDLFITGGYRIREVSSNGVIMTIAGNGVSAMAGDGGPATSAEISDSGAITLDGGGDIFFTDYNRVREISVQGIVTTVAGGGTGGDGGPAASASLYSATGVAIDASGNLYIADPYGNRVRIVSTAGIIGTFAGSGGACQGGPCGGFSGDGGPAPSAVFSYPLDVAVDPSGDVFITDSGNQRVRKVLPTGVISTVAGNGLYGFSGDGGPATLANLNSPFAAVLDAHGNLFLSDTVNNRIREVSPTGIISTVAGNGTRGFSGDEGPALSAALDTPKGIAFDASGNLYIVDSYNFRVRIVSNGIITTFAGNGTQADSGDGGPATAAGLGGPVGVAVDSSGNVFISDGGIRKVSTTGIITSIGTQASLESPEGLAVDSTGNLFIADTANGRVRELSAATGTVTTVAGTGLDYDSNAFGYSGDGGPAIAAELNQPEGVAVDSSGNVFIADTLNAVVREVSAATGIITTIVGKGYPGYSGDGGPATAAVLGGPSDVLLDAHGDLIIVDPAGNALREVWAANPPPGPVAPAAGVVDAAGFSATISGGGIGSIFGTNLAPAVASASFEPLPLNLGGGYVRLNDTIAPLLFVSPGQINFQVPWELLTSTTATLQVFTPNGTSPTVTVNVAPAAPGIFNLNTQGVVVIAGTAIWAAPVGAIPGVTSRPAMAGDYLTLYCSGLGAVTNNPGDGGPASGTELSYVQAPVTAAIGGQNATVTFAGLAPGFVGLYQINLEVPTGVAAGNAVPIVVSTAGLNSNTATIAVQ
jgi:uncharacterized protein (TIGR03437 family)